MTNDELRAIFAASATLYPDVFDALDYVGTEYLVEFEPQVRALLADEEETIRAFAVEVLSTHWLLPNFRNDCEHLAQNDPATWVRSVALEGLIGYGAGSGDITLAHVLWRVLNDSSLPVHERATAIRGIPHVLEGCQASSEFDAATEFARNTEMTEAGFDQLVPWDEIRQLLAQHSDAQAAAARP